MISFGILFKLISFTKWLGFELFWLLKSKDSLNPSSCFAARGKITPLSGMRAILSLVQKQFCRGN